MSVKNVQGSSSDIASRSLTAQKRNDSASQVKSAQAPQTAITISQATQSLAVFRAASSHVTEATVTSIRSFTQSRPSASDHSKVTDPDEATELAEDIANRILDGEGEEAHLLTDGVSRDLF